MWKRPVHLLRLAKRDAKRKKPITGGSDYKVSEKTAYKVQVSTFWVAYKVQVNEKSKKNKAEWVAYKVQVKFLRNF